MTQPQLLDSQNNLLTWYERDARSELPWRQTSDIYHIYLSEIMLQQTQVSRVEAEYYPRFLKRFPTLQSLSQASLDEVFSLWSGLGYYRRAKNLHATAQLCPNELPNTPSELEKLPGIGRYTESVFLSLKIRKLFPSAIISADRKHIISIAFSIPLGSFSSVYKISITPAVWPSVLDRLRIFISSLERTG